MILSFKKFTESISGTELIGSLGPASGREDRRNINSIDKAVYMDGVDMLHSDDIWNKWLEYKKGGGDMNKWEFISLFK